MTWTGISAASDRLIICDHEDEEGSGGQGRWVETLTEGRDLEGLLKDTGDSANLLSIELADEEGSDCLVDVEGDPGDSSLAFAMVAVGMLGSRSSITAFCDSRAAK